MIQLDYKAAAAVIASAQVRIGEVAAFSYILFKISPFTFTKGLSLWTIATIASHANWPS